MKEEMKKLTTSTTKIAEKTLEETPKHTHEEKKEVELLKPPKTEDILTHFDNCPDCHKKILEKAKPELIPDILKTYREKVKSTKDPVICKDCGEIVERAEPKCTNCGNTKAREFKQ